MAKLRAVYDGTLYLYFTIITLVVALALGAVSYYSIWRVEPAIERHLDAEENVNENLRKAYAMLLDPQIFGRYENFDLIGAPIKNIIADYDKKLAANEPFVKEDRMYLEVLFERRRMGSLLGRNTMIFFFLLSALGAGVFAYERMRYGSKRGAQ
ncbi:MAG TPA: hypothetical protein PKM65_17990 [Spirochaetota bacterium]|nr:hypothetical protein [Spirochaetota bacterium]HNT13084.1 hypothetical protein [Spirochaetota bacterium]